MNGSKKEKEEVIIRYFFEKLVSPPKGKLVAHESPDFILRKTNKYAIGIELTQLQKPGESPFKDLSKLISDINRAIISKNDKIELYKKNILNEYWLIIISESIEIPGVKNLKMQLTREVAKSEFQKTYLLDLFNGRIYELS